ncbi:peroxiredoxin [Candidatus Nitrosacidococcus sp. I8]|uniref:peroxiredoxin n=1 Tax=Candidatus Nitrosacidococcus sp. I8 TaxID=2942908 RepID=UPI002227AC8F|nr:peroxiredoxin [Candidatus Nitrosacidococcus sp. I8]CAH9019116.1 Putative peroxiredoxin bcp [Candidatus Nitrosacidococcus sp. I8]
MSKITVGSEVPDFEIPSTANKSFKLSQFKGQNIVLYFYPKDDTPGCTREGQAFRDLSEEFEQANTLIFGISKDSIQSHEIFRNQQHFPFDLLSDENEVICQLFDVIKPKKIFGKDTKGIERSTFLIDKNGVLHKEWRQVKVEDHVIEVLDIAKALD